MPDDLKTELPKEIARIKRELEYQKRVIRKNIGKQLAIERAEAKMRALHARLAVLEANLALQTGSRLLAE